MEHTGHLSSELASDRSGDSQPYDVKYLSDGPPLSYLRPVPRHLVHRAAVTEVFITDAVRRGDTGFLIAAQWPRDHTLYHPDPLGYADPLLCAETVRQALVYIAHTYGDIPLGHRFIGRSLGFELTRPDATLISSSPQSVLLDAEWTPYDRSTRGRFGVRLNTAFAVDGVECGRGHIEVLIVDERRYKLLRRAGAASAPPTGGAAENEPYETMFDPVPISATGRLRAKDGLLEQSLDGRRWRMRIDENHAVLFDHPTDHVPLMVILEGFRQLGHVLTRAYAARGASAGGLVATRIQCDGWGELDLPIDLVVERAQGSGAGPRRLRLAAVQAGNRLATATLDWADRETAGHCPSPSPSPPREAGYRTLSTAMGGTGAAPVARAAASAPSSTESTRPAA
jgi:2-oxo-3-(phosphooxy)propyl 3-oxoalkanoate synthase